MRVLSCAFAGCIIFWMHAILQSAQKGGRTHIAIMHVPRARSYLCLTLSSVVRDALPCASAVTVFSSAADALRECQELSAHVHVEYAPENIQPLPFYELVLSRMMQRARRHRWRHPRGCKVPPGDTFVVLEDDVVLARNFSALLRHAITYVDARLQTASERGWPPAEGLWSTRDRPRGPPARLSHEFPFILSLYQGACCDTFANLTAKAQSELSTKDGGVDDWWSWGTAAMAFRGDVAAHLAEALSTQKNNFTGLQDMFIHDFATRNNYTMWTTNPSLVQHCGVHSSLFGANTRFHMTLAFADDADAVLRSHGMAGWAALGE